MATKKMLTLPSQKLVLPTQLPGDVTQKRMIGNPTFTPDGKQITGGSGVTYSLKDMGGQDTPYTTTEVVGVKGGPAPSSESLDSILASNRQAMQRASTPNVSNVSGNKNTVIPNTKLLAQAGGQSDSLPGAISPEDRIPGVYYPTPLPTPNTPTPTNPVTKNSLQKAVPIAPDMAQIQQMDINNLNDTIDKLQIKQSKEQLSDEELLTLRRATRQLQQSMTPQSLTGGLDEMIAKKETNITETTNKLDKQNEQELAQFKQSQEAYKQSEIQAIEQADEEQKKTLGYILGAQGAGTSSFGAEQINKITQNSLQKKQVLAQAVQAKIDLYGSQLRKDSQETIQTLQTNLDNLYMKVAEFDVENIKELNAFNKEQGASKIKEIDGLMALAQSQALSSKELTPEEQKQVDTFANNLYDENGNFKEDVFKMLKEINPNLANLAVYNGGAIQKQRIADNLAMKGLDADIKRAELNKLLNPDVDYKVTANDDGTYTRTGSDGSVAIVDPTADVGGLSGAELAKTLASGKVNGKKFFGVYATGDPDGTQFASIYNKVAEQGLDAYMKSRQDRGSKITADMVNQAAIATGVDPITIAAKMAQDSGMGTQGKGARNNNPGNVGQFDSLDAKGITVKGYNTLEDGVLAVADNFKKRQDALLSVAPQKRDVTPGSSDISRFNDNTFDPSKLKSAEKGKYTQFLKDKESVMQNKNASIQDILKYSAGSKELDATAITRLEKYNTVLGQLDGIQKQISSMDTGPILGKLRSINPYDTDAQVLKAQLQALIPNLARGVYGEVGVLTDNDIKNYAQTIPNLTQTKDVQKAILALTLDTLAGGYKNQLQSLAAAKRDVSGYSGLYDSVKGQADALRSEIQGNNTASTKTTTTGGGRRQG